MIRSALEQRSESQTRRLQEWLKIENHWLGALQAEVLLGVGFRFDPQEFHLPTAEPAGVRRALKVAVDRKAALATELAPGEQLQAQHLRLALVASLAASRPDSEVRELWDLAVGLGALDSKQTALRERFAQFDILARQLPGHPEAQDLRAQVTSHQQETLGALRGLLRGLRSLPTPAGIVEAGTDLGKWVVPTVPQIEDLGAVHGAAQIALQRFAELYLRVLGRLADVAEKAKTAALSLPRSPRPG
jgi:hypothetical protein